MDSLKCGEDNEALLVANKIQGMEVKIPSNTVNMIRREIKKYVEKGNKPRF